MDHFPDAVSKLLQLEGGYVNDPNDPGGETKYGISKRSYPTLDIRALTMDQAEEIYRRDWWERYGYARIDAGPVAVKLLDMSVNMGADRAHRLLQEACNLFGAGLEVDGKLGPKTFGAVNGVRHPLALVAALKVLAGGYYIRLGKPQFLAGWLNRAVS